MLREHEALVEADLQRFFAIDYRDRWRFENGRRKLTLRRISVLLASLPDSESPLIWTLFNDGQPIWPITAHVTDDLRIAMTSTDKKKAPPHPARFNTKRITSGWGDPKRIRKLQAARARARARRRALSDQER